jgi:hypothetical protein
VLFYLLHNGTFPKPIIATGCCQRPERAGRQPSGHGSAQQMTAAELTNLSVKRPSLMQEI